MSAAKTLVILLVFALAAEAKHHKRCITNADCRKFSECCAKWRCKPVIPIGNRCNIYRQFWAYQCPCTIGSTCRELRSKKRQKLKKRMICTKIFWPLDVEKVERLPIHV